MIEFFLKRKVLANLVTLFVIMVGGWQFLTVRREAFPDFSFDIVIIETLYPGASPQEVERLVTAPIEDELRGVTYVDKVQSWSLEDRSQIVIWLDEDIGSREVDKAVQDIQQAVNRVRDLPAEVERPVVREISSDRPLITVSVAGGADDARDRFAEELQDRLEDIPGVSKVDAEGDQPREIWVEVIPSRLRELKLSIAQVAEAIRANNMNLPGGPIEVGERELFVRTDGMLETADEVASVIVRGNDDRTFIRVRDVARVRETFAEKRVLYRSEGEAAINLLVRKQRKGDTIHLVDAVRRLCEELRPAAEREGLSLRLSNDFSYFIKRRLGVMRSNMLQGGILIMIALFVFLDWRLAVVAAWGVPISFATAFAVGIPLGVTINLLSLMALIIVLGMLDDDSVVVAENIYRHLEMGKSPERAAIDGTREVILPVLGSVSAACAAFLPFAMVSGITGKFMLVIPTVIILCFIASLLEAFFILPAHVVEMARFGKPIDKDSSKGRWYLFIVDRYRRTLDWLLHHRWKTSLLLAGFGLATAALAAWRLQIIMFPSGLIDQFFIKAEFQPGTSLTQSLKNFSAAEAAVMALPRTELDTVITTIGLQGFDDEVRRGTHYAQARVFLTPEENRPRSTDAVIAGLRQRLEGRLPGLKSLEFEKLRTGPPVGRAIYLRVRGKDMAVMNAIVEKVKREVAALPGVSDVRSTWEEGKEELRVQVLPEAASFAGLNVESVARHVLFAYEGGQVTKIRRPTEEVDIKVRLPESVSNRMESLEALEVANNRGYTVPLQRVVKATAVPAPPFIERYNFRRTITVSANVDDVTMTSRRANALLKKRLAGVPREFPGNEIIFGGEEEDTQKSLDSLFRAFGTCVLLIYVIVAALFGSYVQPFLILLTVPIGLTGVVYALVLHNDPLSFMALLGVVAMTGVVVNNAIVLVNFINQARAEGKSARDACLDAGSTRLRPIWASSVTTLLGLFPTAYGFGGQEPFVQPMALALAWGLTFAMPLTLFVIPIAYVVLDDLKTSLRTLLKRR